MFERDTAKYQKQQEEYISKLVAEGVNGITKMDHPPNEEQPLYGEAEAMYFNAIRKFFENSISRRVMNTPHQSVIRRRTKMNETLATTSMTKEEVIENLKTMIFGEQAFERFTSDERETLDRAIVFLEK